MDEILKSLGRLEAGQESMRADITDIKEGVADYRNTKNKVIGGSVTLSVIAGALWSAIFRKYN